MRTDAPERVRICVKCATKGYRTCQCGASKLPPFRPASQPVEA